MALTTAEAYLRVALLVARADGRESPEEMLVTANGITSRLGAKPVTADELRRATTEVASTPPFEVLDRINRALAPGEPREHAFQLACEVANADRRLAAPETQQIVELARALGLRDGDVHRILTDHWTTASPGA